MERPARRDRVWQVDFSAFETAAEGAWALCPVVDYAAEPALACPVAATQTAADLLVVLTAAVNTAEALLGRPLLEDLTDEATGETTPLVIVSDNGPAMKSTATARWFAARAHLAHVRTRRRAPWTNIGASASSNAGSSRVAETRPPPPRRDPQRRRPRRPCDRVHRRIQHGPTPRNARLAAPLDTYLTDPTLKPKPRKREQKC